MLFVLIILLLTGVLLGGTYFYMNKKDVVGDTEIIGPSPTLPDKVIQPKIYKPVYPKAQFIKVGKIGIVEDFKNRSINLMEIYVYDKDGKNIALKKPILSNTTFGDFKNTLYNLIDGDEMTMGRTGNEKEDDTQPQRQSFEIDLGSMHEIRSVVLLDKIKGDPGRLDKLKVMLLDDNLQIVDKTSNLTTEQAKKGTKHRYDFGTKKWTLEPVDCVGKWGEWSACSTGCVEEGKNNEGQKKRDWITLRKAENGGKACVYDVNKDGFKVCKGSIGKWSGCKKTDPYDCKGKMSFIVTDKGEDEGKTCPKPKDCKVGGWCLRHNISNRYHALKSVKNGRWVADDGDEAMRGNRGAVHGWERHYFQKVGNGTYAIRGGRAGRWCADDGGAIRCNRGHILGWERFRIYDLGGNRIALRGGRSNQFCANDHDDVLRCNRNHIQNWEMFELHHV